MTPSVSPVKESPVKASYTVTYTVTVDLEYDTTKGRPIDHLVDDIADALVDDSLLDDLWEAFPAIQGVSIDQGSYKLMRSIKGV